MLLLVLVVGALVVAFVGRSGASVLRPDRSGVAFVFPLYVCCIRLNAHAELLMLNDSTTTYGGGNTITVTDNVEFGGNFLLNLTGTFALVFFSD